MTRGDRAADGLRRLQTVLEPVFPATPPRSATWRLVALAAAAVAAGIALSLLRQTGAPALDTVWAEDGREFLTDALALPAADSIPKPYVGYRHLWPRAVAELAAALPLPLASQVLALAAAAATALCGLVVYAATAGHIRTRTIRGVLAALVVAQPAAAFESLNSPALTQWFLVYPVFWLALWRPQRRATVAWVCAFVVLTVLSAPLALVLAPLYLLRLVVARSWRDRAVTLAFLPAAALQLWTLLTATDVEPAARSGVGVVLRVFLQRVVGATVYGVSGAERMYVALGRWAVLAAFVLLAACLAAGVVRRGFPQWPTAVLAVGTAGVMFVGSVAVRGAADAMAFPAGGGNPAFSRYVMVPVLLLYSALALVLDVRHPRVAAERWRGLQVGALAFVGVVVGMDLLAANVRSLGPRWSERLAEQRISCTAAAPPPTVYVDTSPPQPPWGVRVACDDLLGDLPADPSAP